jgi:hypothetical protein
MVSLITGLWGLKDYEGEKGWGGGA